MRAAVLLLFLMLPPLFVFLFTFQTLIIGMRLDFIDNGLIDAYLSYSSIINSTMFIIDCVVLVALAFGLSLCLSLKFKWKRIAYSCIVIAFLYLTNVLYVSASEQGNLLLKVVSVNYRFGKGFLTQTLSNAWLSRMDFATFVSLGISCISLVIILIELRMNILRSLLFVTAFASAVLLAFEEQVYTVYPIAITQNTIATGSPPSGALLRLLDSAMSLTNAEVVYISSFLFDFSVSTLVIAWLLQKINSTHRNRNLVSNIQPV